MSQSSRSNTSSSGNGKDLFIYEIPPSSRQLLCDHLDELNVWNQLALIMSLKPNEVQTIRRKQVMGNSPTNELLNIWGGQYNHTVTELFYVLKKYELLAQNIQLDTKSLVLLPLISTQRQNLYPAMRLLKDFVERKYHILIPSSQPQISQLMAPETPNEHSKKILNCNTSSGVSNSNNDDTSDNNNRSSMYRSTSDSNKQSNYLSQRNVQRYASSILEINYHELSAATCNWKFELGKGGFGTVYKGYWKHTDVAIKKIYYRGPNGQDSIKVQIQQILNELKYLNSCRHDNVLPLYGYSIKGENPCLVYQLMTGGSMEQRLYSKEMTPLTWQQRLNICLGTARGINFLHTFRDKPLIHGDIKPANVLLDQCLQPKIGDFGLAREGPNAINSAVEVTQVFGTKPYLPPEFLNSKKLSTQVDTYSFGVVLLETFTGMRAYDKNRANPLLTKHIVKLCTSTENKIEDFIDKKIPLLPGDENVCTRSISLGIECIADCPTHRPEMEQVLKTIHNYSNLSAFQL